VPWLLKTEPSDYSFDDLVREKRTVWSGVTNAAAVKNLASMKTGDRIVVYHTGSVRAAVGTATVAAADAKDPKSPRVTIAAGKRLPAPVSLEAVKGSPLFADSPLLRIGRLSVVPLTEAQFRFLAGEDA
jgi:predicted RNA-binding protein with PUA-like domain